MVEVVQDLLDYVTYAGGVGRRRADAVIGLGSGTVKPGAHDCALVAKDRTDHAPQMVPLRDLVFDEVLDKQFDDKVYGLQMLELSYRGERLMNELAQKFHQVNRLVEHDPLWRSKHLPSLLQKMCEGLRHVQLLISKELQEVWKIAFPPIFYPSDTDILPDALPGGWLDLEDLFLTVHLLLRYLSEMMNLAGDLVREVPGARTMSRRQIRDAPVAPKVFLVVQGTADKAPWLGISVVEKEPGSDGTSEGESPLRKALAILNEVLMDQVQDLLSDLHRATYRAFIRVVAAYGRWKKTCKSAREKRQAEEHAKKLAERKMRSSRNSVMGEEVGQSAASTQGREGHDNAEPTEPKEGGPGPRRRRSIYGQSGNPSSVSKTETQSLSLGPPEGAPSRSITGERSEATSSFGLPDGEPRADAPRRRRGGVIFGQPTTSTELNRMD